MTNNQDLIKSCDDLTQSIDRGIDWAKTPGNLDGQKQNAVIYNLKRYKREAQRYAAAAAKRPSVAIFGQSQVGKSYLVANLAKTTDQEDLEIVGTNDNERINFIDKINPPGGGKEATGLVSRFTVAYEDNTTYPYKLELLSQADILRIIINGYMADIMNYADDTYIERNEYQKELDAIKRSLSSQHQPGFTEDEVYDIKEYISVNFRNHHIADGMHAFWDDLAAIVPYIPSEERWKVFHVLWGKREFFTELFNNMSAGLKKLKFHDHVWCGLDATPDNMQTIVDVERLRELYKPQSAKPPIKVYLEDGTSISMERSIVSGLTAEIILRLPKSVAEDKQRTFLKQADILDFPGARSRKKIPEATFLQNTQVEKLQIFLRGKIAFLFDRYNTNYEISTLLYCHNNSPQNVEDIPHLLYDWIHRTHGENKQKRTQREQKLRELVPDNNTAQLVPLLFIMTMFNIELAEKKNGIDGHSGKWTARLRENFNDFLSNPLIDKWPSSWSDHESAFKNSFLLRDPKYAMGVYEENEGKEKITSPYVEQLENMKKSFLKHPDVKKHFRHPEEAWEEAVRPGKSGINYIVKYLTPTSHPNIKREQIKAKILELKNEVDKELRAFYLDGDIKKQLQMARLKAATHMQLTKAQTDYNNFGFFLDYLLISDVIPWKLYFDLMVGEGNKEYQEQKSLPLDLLEMLNGIGLEIKSNVSADEALAQIKEYMGVDDEALIKEHFNNMGFDISAITDSKEKGGFKSKSDIYAEQLLTKWFEQLDLARKDIPKKQEGFNQYVADTIIEELKNTTDRVYLKRQIIDTVEDFVENFQYNDNVAIVAHLSTMLINSFVNTFGWNAIPEEERPKNSKQIPVFSTKNLAIPAKEQVGFNMDFPGKEFFTDWTIALRDAFEANVYYYNDVSDADKAEANVKLGEILQKIEAISVQ